jgi:menaquinone-9 beta-reductase
VTLVARDGRPLRVPAQVTIAADGRRSPIAFALGLAHQPAWPRRWAIGGYFTDVDGLDTVGEMHVRPGHYIGVAPLPDGLTNVCFVTPPDERAARRELADPEAVLMARITADPLLRDRMGRARLVGPVTMLGPLAVDVRVAGMRGLLLAGDAAGFIDPMTGDGLRFALRGAELAAEVAQACVERPECDGHLTLTARRAREFAGKYRFNRGVRAFVASRAAVDAASLGARLAPGILRQMIRYAGDGAR